MVKDRGYWHAEPVMVSEVQEWALGYLQYCLSDMGMGGITLTLTLLS